MGANQSTVPVNEKLVVERLHAMRLQTQPAEETPETEYVHINEKSRHFEAPWTSLSVGDVAAWEHELLADPKNRCVVPRDSPITTKALSNVQIDSPFLRSLQQIQKQFSHPVPPRSKILISSTSRSLLKEHPSRTNDPLDAAGYSHPQMFFV